MTSGPKLGRCKPCILLSSTFAIISVALLVASIAGAFASTGSLVYVISTAGLGFFGGLTVLHLIARFTFRRATRKTLEALEAKMREDEKSIGTV
jgi:hypothetical protein